MDQLKAYSAVAAKHWFWIATAMVTLLSVGIWWLSSGKLLNEFEAARSQLDSDAQKITTVRNSLSTHPNDISHREMEKLIEARTESVMAAWTSVYSRQQNILKWPVKELKDDFVREFRDLIPIELKVAFPTPEEEEVVPSFRSRYRDYIGDVLPSLAEIAKTKWTADWDRVRGGTGGFGFDGGMDDGYDPGGDDGGEGGGEGGFTPGVPQEEGPLVTWATSSQEKLLSDLFPWRGSQPTTLDVLYSQENLWILRQLMRIIADVNGDAGQRFQAKIRGINRIAIGRSVPKTAGTISKPGSRSSGGFGGEDLDGDDLYGGGMDGEFGGDDLYGPGGMDGDGSMMGMEPVATDPGDNRYVDTQGSPLTASQLRSALSSNSPTDAFMAVAKRVPVMMSFKMDQRNVPDLLAACGSAPLMVEVRQVRILPAGAAGPGGFDGMDGGMGDGYGGEDDGGGETSFGPPMGATSGTADQFPLDMTVEVYGIIYIYNPPQTEALGIDQVTEDIVVEGTGLGEGRRADPAPAESPDIAPAPEPAAVPDTVPQPEAAPQPETAPEPMPVTDPDPAATTPAEDAGEGPRATPPPADGANRNRSPALLRSGYGASVIAS